MPRVFLFVLDGAGVGGAPDAASYGDEGASTIPNLSRAAGGLNLPTLQSMGLGNIADILGVSPAEKPLASWGLMVELSKGKDTITGHWEMAGIVNETAFPTYPHGFPPEVIEKFERISGRKAIGNRPASGTEIIKELGQEHLRTGSPIVYTSADSVFQIAAHEDIIPPEELYDICKKLRAALVPPHNICRVIARPFIGPPFARTPRRKDFGLFPPGKTVLDYIYEKGVEVVSIGKVIDMFGGRGFTRFIKMDSNEDAMRKMDDLEEKFSGGLVFLNFTDFDTLYGHRNDSEGYKKALQTFDGWLGTFIERLEEGDYLFITADHGCDPTFPTTDHTRERAPLLFYNSRISGRPLGIRKGFVDIAATVAEIFGIEDFPSGRSFLRA